MGQFRLLPELVGDIDTPKTKALLEKKAVSMFNLRISD